MNRLRKDKQIMALSMPVEGAKIRAIERMTVHAAIASGKLRWINIHYQRETPLVFRRGGSFGQTLRSALRTRCEKYLINPLPVVESNQIFK